MNFFFGLNLDNCHSLLTIPKFTNEGNLIKQNSLFKLMIKKDYWLIKKQYCDEDENFFYLDISVEDIENFFFLCKEDFCGSKGEKKINELSSFNNIKTNFTFRANLRIYNKNKEYTSYQSDYPLDMVKRTGDILTTVSSLLNQDQDNLLVFKQIYFLPVKKPFSVYLVNLQTEKVVVKRTFYTNSTNILNLNHIKDLKNCCFFSDGFLGLPIFVSYGQKKGLSMEHSHPPHLYILSDNKYKVVSALKEKVKKIVSQLH